MFELIGLQCVNSCSVIMFKNGGLSILPMTILLSFTKENVAFSLCVQFRHISVFCTLSSFSSVIIILIICIDLLNAF